MKFFVEQARRRLLAAVPVTLAELRVATPGSRRNDTRVGLCRRLDRRRVRVLRDVDRRSRLRGRHGVTSGLSCCRTGRIRIGGVSFRSVATVLTLATVTLASLTGSLVGILRVVGGCGGAALLAGGRRRAVVCFLAAFLWRVAQVGVGVGSRSLLGARLLARRLFHRRSLRHTGA